MFGNDDAGMFLVVGSYQLRAARQFNLFIEHIEKSLPPTFNHSCYSFMELRNQVLPVYTSMSWYKIRRIQTESPKSKLLPVPLRFCVSQARPLLTADCRLIHLQQKDSSLMNSSWSSATSSNREEKCHSCIFRQQHNTDSLQNSIFPIKVCGLTCI